MPLPCTFVDFDSASLLNIATISSTIVENTLDKVECLLYYFNTGEHREVSEYCAVLSNLSVIAVTMPISVENGEVVKSLFT